MSAVIKTGKTLAISALYIEWLSSFGIIGQVFTTAMYYP